MLTRLSLQDFGAHVASQGHAMAGATIAASAALACSLGEACVRISELRLEAPIDCARSRAVAERLAALRAGLLDLADEDGAAITTFAGQRDAGDEAQGEDRLCAMPVQISLAASEAATTLQEFRPLAQGVQDDLEMAIVLLAGAARASALLLDSNLRIWPYLPLLEMYEPQLARLRQALAGVSPVDSIR